MKKYLTAIAALAAAIGFAQWVGAASSVRDQIAERLEPVGSVCIEGEDCASAESQSVANADTGGSAGTGGGDATAAEAIYDKSCSTCHETGTAGAPKLGDTEQWASRLEKGKEALYDSAINGLPPGMPAKGLCMTCSEEELKAVTDYMVAAAEE